MGPEDLEKMGRKVEGMSGGRRRQGIPKNERERVTEENKAFEKGAGSSSLPSDP